MVSWTTDTSGGSSCTTGSMWWTRPTATCSTGQCYSTLGSRWSVCKPSLKICTSLLLKPGFKEAMTDRNWTCAIFHDVDLLPEDDRNIYNCPEQPRWDIFGQVHSISPCEALILKNIVDTCLLPWTSLNTASRTRCSLGEPPPSDQTSSGFWDTNLSQTTWISLRQHKSLSHNTILSQTTQISLRQNNKKISKEIIFFLAPKFFLRELNGYSNMFWGWGAEDDDMSKRTNSGVSYVHSSWNSLLTNKNTQAIVNSYIA